ncbi:MAG: T9SS type A sorting domain-containing protein [Bacteroidales bacterium]|nr:T9SS type A sorting domain-containing protein [Bacteroidales bacterium]
MKRFTLTGFVLVFLMLISAVSFSQETTLPDDDEIIRIMRQYGITPQATKMAPGVLPKHSELPKEQTGTRGISKLFDNGPFVTHPGGGVGGADFSFTNAPYQQAGYQVNWPNYRMSDDLVVSGTDSWAIDVIRLYAYQSTSPTSPSPIQNAYIQVWSAAPNAGGTVIWGNLVTSRLINTEWANCYRGNNLTQTNRPVMVVDCRTPGLELQPGTYWIDYTIEGSAGYGPAAIIPVTITGQPITGNAITTFNNGTTWSSLGGIIYKQGAPFTVFGYVGSPEAPEVIDDFAVTPAAMGALSAELAWTNPSITQSGSPLPSLSSVSIYRNDVLIHENTSPVIGAAETFTDTPTQPGVYQYEIFATNSNGNSPKTTVTVYVGEDVPAAPANVLLIPVNNGNDAEITWDEPTEGLNGGYFTGATGYTLVRMPDSTVLANNWSGTQPFIDNTLPAFGFYAYRVTAVNDIGNGGTGVSNGELLGPFVYTKSAYANNFNELEFVSVDVITGKQTFIADNTVDPSFTYPKEVDATFVNGVCYVADGHNNRLIIKTDNGIEVPIGPLLLNGASVIPMSMAYDAATSTMYMIVINPTSLWKSLCTIDLGTLEMTEISGTSLILDRTLGLEFLPDGYLYSIDISAEQLVKIDPATGTKTVIGPIGFNADNFQALSYEPTLNRLYSYAHGLGDDRYGYYDITTGLFTSLTNNLETWISGFAIKDPLVLEEVDAVAFYVETPEVVKDRFGVGETTPVNVKVGNYGLSAASFDVTVEIGDDYSETLSVTNLGSIQETDLVFPDWTPAVAGAYDVVLTVSDPGGDGNLENNTISRVIDVYDGCRHKLTLYSQYNDGWFGDWAQVYINWVLYYDYITKPAGVVYELPVYAEEGDLITFIYYGDGLYNAEHSWELLDGEGNQLFTGAGTQYYIEQSATANCPPSIIANILSFSFNTEENPSLFNDVNGQIDPVTSSITLEVLENANLSDLVATFTLSDGASAMVGTVTQVSAVTPNDFTNPVVYTVTAEAGNTQDWTITVNALPCLSPWNYAVTGSQHIIIIPVDAAPEIFGEPLAPYDWIGVFFLNDDGEETCGGAIQWTGTGNVGFMAYADDPTTPEKDGFDSGEPFHWRLSRCGNPEEFTAIATYDPNQPSQGNFQSLGISMLTSLKAAYIQYFILNQGWNSMSSYIVPFTPAVEDLFAPIVSNLTILSNLTTMYWPQQGVNTIGNWNSNSGYVAKVTEDVEFMIGGADYVSGTMTIPAGWSYLPVLSECPADVMEMFGGNLNEVVIIQELIGTQIFWPQFEVYTLETFEPGKAYKIKLANAVTVTFPECGGLKSNFTPAQSFNSMETGWGTIKMTPYTQSVVFLANSLVDFNAGDMIGAFDESGKIWGYVQINSNSQNQTITLFGNDFTTLEKNGFAAGESIIFKLLRAETGEVIDLEVEYDQSVDNASGTFLTNSVSAVTNVTLLQTGIDQFSASSVRMFPNPARDVLNLSINGANDQTITVEIYDNKGVAVARESFSNNTALNISHLAPGVYFVNIRTTELSETRKLVVK